MICRYRSVFLLSALFFFFSDFFIAKLLMKTIKTNGSKGEKKFIQFSQSIDFSQFMQLKCTGKWKQKHFAINYNIIFGVCAIQLNFYFFTFECIMKWDGKVTLWPLALMTWRKKRMRSHNVDWTTAAASATIKTQSVCVCACKRDILK